MFSSFFFSSRRRHTRWPRDWSSDVCSSDLALAATHGISTSRVKEVVEMTGLQTVAKKRVGGFSLGMGQRLGIAAAMLEIGRASCRERVEGSVVEGAIRRKTYTKERKKWSSK